MPLHFSFIVRLGIIRTYQYQYHACVSLLTKTILFCLPYLSADKHTLGPAKTHLQCNLVDLVGFVNGGAESSNAG